MRQTFTKVVIIGTGYVGLTTGVCLAYLGNQVACVDSNAAVIRQLRQGEVPVAEPGIAALMQQNPANLYFTTALAEVLNGSDIVIIAVGTPAKPNGATDMSYLEAVAREIGAHLTDGKKQLIVNKSTVPVGSARRVKTIIDYMLLERGIDCEYSVAANPEFLQEGAAVFNTLYPDRIVVGAEDEAAVGLLHQLYSPVLNQTFTPPAHLPRPRNYQLPAFITTNPASAELIKYASNAFLATKISFINEIAGLAEKVGADIKEVALGVGLDTRVGRRYLEAGIGWGGSCFGKDLKSIINDAGQYGYSMNVLQAALEANTRQRYVVIEKLQQELKVIRGSIIGILGLAFKPGTADLRDAPSVDIIAKLLELGARVKVYDPLAMPAFQEQHGELEVEYCQDVLTLSKNCDALILVTEWSEFSAVPWETAGAGMRRRVFIDGRNLFDARTLQIHGFAYHGIGRS
ncbi:udp-glucose/gdp-mannose dehydrogenase dimerisation [Lucifera butyrica]|uniref:UDP-glucose 6-dehydrogenase n=1 Tax=Lucifera butyrica TaxID=1351585 RepID=A0A498RI58_9FIRM|nr:UDP-glucose/GDP-mannose dehydrogenase family protein [Lucifera butyrica]VBB09793.1 udp-glucose/gdp-mannose dehydrogenase dimerisation [Lucifera butyrica]